MPMFVKKPCAVEARQVPWASTSDGRDPETAAALRELAAWCGGYVDGLCIEIPAGANGMIACPGDWIINISHREFRPCRPRIFAATYAAA